MNSNTTTRIFGILFCTVGISAVSLARNEGFSRDSGDRSGSWSGSSPSVSRGSAPAVSESSRGSAASGAARSFSQPSVSVRSAPAPTYTPRSVQQAPAVQAPSPRSGGSFYSGGAPSVAPSTPPVYSVPRVTESAPRVQTVTPSRQPPAVSYQPARPVETPSIQAPARLPAQTVRTPQPEAPAVTPRFSPQTDSARSFGTVRTPSVAAETPAVTPPSALRTLPDAGGQGLSRSSLNVTRETGRSSGPALSVPPASSLTAPGRSSAFSRDSAVGRTSSPRLGGSDLRLDTPTVSGPVSASPVRFGSAGIRGPASRGDAASLPSAFSLRSPRGDADTDRFGRAALPRTTLPAASPRESLSSAYSPARSGASRHGESHSLYRPPYGSMDHNHQPQHRPPPYPYDHHNDHHDHHHDDHHHHHPSYYGWWYSPYACSPVWWGPVVYPAGFGLTWYSGSFALSIATYAPSCYYTRYYDSWCGGGWGYTSVYYGGWRSGWYGGFSYVYNPWPAYRTYYFYDPYPVTETVYVTQPATTVYVTQPATTTVVSQPTAAATSYAAAPASYAAPAASYDAGSWDSAPAVQRTDAAVTTCFCPCRCNGLRPCTCAYPCGSEYALRDEDFDLSLAFASYADTLSAETIWSSYAGLDRWEIRADAYEHTTVATAAGEGR